MMLLDLKALKQLAREDRKPLTDVAESFIREVKLFAKHQRAYVMPVLISENQFIVFHIHPNGFVLVQISGKDFP